MLTYNTIRPLTYKMATATLAIESIVFSIVFRHQSIAHGVSGKWNSIGFVCSSDSRPQKDFSLAMASGRAALSGNASLIATFSSFYRATLC